MRVLKTVYIETVVTLITQQQSRSFGRFVPQQGTLVQRYALHWSYFRRNRTMYKDEIIAEVWRNRDIYVEKHHHSLKEIVRDLQKRQETPHSKVVDRRRRRTGQPS